MTTLDFLTKKPDMTEGLPFTTHEFGTGSFAFALALEKSKELLNPEAEVNTIVVKSVDTGRQINEFMISIFSTRGNLSVVVPSDESTVLAWRS